MRTWRTFVTLVQLMLPALSDGVITTCEIPSVEAGDNATMIIHFSEDLTQKQSKDFSVVHVSQSETESEMLSCIFSNGDVKCDKSQCCTWESKVTDVFRVYIHNASQQLEGKFWAFVIPTDVSDHNSCNFILKASTCSTNSINATNSHMTCSNQSVAIGQTCTVICNSGYYIQQTQVSVTYTCVGKQKWSPEIPVKSCEVHYRDQTSQNLYLLFLLLSALPFVTVVIILFKRRHKEKTKRKNKEDPLLPLKYISKLTEDNQKHIEHSTHISSALTPGGSRTSQGTNHFSTNQTAKNVNLHDQAPQQSAEDYWLECIRTWYPELQSRTYFLPPFHFNRVSYDVQIVAGNQVLVPQNPQDSDVRDVRAIERVLQCLRALADDPLQKQIMMVVSQLQFGKYLGEPSYAAAAALLQSPSQLPRHRYDKGDCDVLIIHSKLGLLTLEIRSVGGNFSQQEMTEQEEDDVVMKEVKKALKQLNRAEFVLKHLTTECIANTHITKILVLPNIKSSQLLRAVNRTPDGQFLCQCFDVQNVDDAVKMCLLSDQLSDKHMSADGNHSSHQALREWWQYIVKTSGPEQLMTSSLYEQLVARFCGPATTVDVHCVTAPRLNIRTLGEAVSETGERVARLVLFPQQVDILNRPPPRAFLSGPPGTGKTIVLIIQGLTWLQRGHDVHVVSTWDGSRAATTVIEHQLQETVKTSTARSRVHRHQFDFEKDGEVKTAVRWLKSLSEGRQLCVIADEVVRDDRKSFTEFCDRLIVQVPGVFIWGASVHRDVRPLCLEEVKLTTPLRSPPVVVREVMESKEIKELKLVHNYTFSDVPVPTDGPPVMRIEHRDGQLGHTEGLPLDCVECGHQVARVLRELDVGQTGDSNGPPPLKYRDVLVLCYPNDDRLKRFGRKNTTASGLVRGLRDRHVPVRVVEKGDGAAIRDTALGVGDLVTVANWHDVQGLERKVVVVETGIGGLDWFNRLLAMSRCTSQLVLIDS